MPNRPLSVEHLPAPAVIEGVIVDDAARFDRLCEGMVESMTEFDWAPGGSHSLPEHLREALRDWCRQLREWDEGRL